MFHETKLSAARLFAFVVGVKQHRNYFDAKTTADNLFQGSRAIRDQDVLNFINQMLSHDLYNCSSSLREFTECFKDWLPSSLNRIEGLEKFQADFSAGTTQAFDSFYFRHRNLKFRCFVGEYFYHLKNWISNSVKWSFISDDDPLTHGDALVLSVPFCDTGSLPDNLDSILNICSDKKIPVLIDACYYPISNIGIIDVDRPCVDTVCFSLSKLFPVSHFRIGVRYTRPAIYDGQKLHDSIGYNNYISSYIGLNLIKNFDSDYIYLKYKDKQKEVSNYFELDNSQSVLFGIGDQQWRQYGRKSLLNSYKLNFSEDLFVNRICLNSIYENWDLFQRIKIENRTKI